MTIYCVKIAVFQVKKRRNRQEDLAGPVCGRQGPPAATPKTGAEARGRTESRTRQLLSLRRSRHCRRAGTAGPSRLLSSILAEVPLHESVPYSMRAVHAWRALFLPGLRTDDGKASAAARASPGGPGGNHGRPSGGRANPGSPGSETWHLQELEIHKYPSQELFFTESYRSSSEKLFVTASQDPCRLYSTMARPTFQAL